MKKTEFTVLTDIALITCIVERGFAEPIVTAARNAGAQGATVYYAHGIGIREKLGLLGIAVNTEKEVINIVVSTEQAEHIFETMYQAGQLDTPGRGFMYVTPLDKAATYVPPRVIEKLSKTQKKNILKSESKELTE